MPRKHLGLRSMYDLAARYVALTNGDVDPDDAKYDEAWPILQEMLGRVGTDNTNVYLDQARETHRMVHGPRSTQR
jgi:hypothetical protein